MHKPTKPKITSNWKTFFLLVISFIILNFSSGSSQHNNHIELTPFLGWQFGGNFTAKEGKLNIGEANNLGLLFNFVIPEKPGLRAEILYSRQNSDLDFQTDSSNSTLFDMSVEYFHAGGTYEEMRGLFGPFVSISVGFTRFNPGKENVDDEWFLSGSLGMGAKAFLAEKIGIRLQGRILASVLNSENSIFCSNNQCMITIDTGALLLQGDLTAGLVISL
jgi:hypothetical protein